MEKIKFRKSPLSVKIIYIAFFAMFVVFAFMYVYPIFWAIINSLKSMDRGEHRGSRHRFLCPSQSCVGTK